MDAGGFFGICRIKAFGVYILKHDAYLHLSLGVSWWKRKGEWEMDYMTAKSRVDRDWVLLKSPLRLKPGAWVELRTCIVF